MSDVRRHVPDSVTATFGEAARKATYSEDEMIELCIRFQDSEEGDTFLESVALGEVDTKMAHSLARTLFGPEFEAANVPEDIAQLERFGDMLFAYKRDGRYQDLGRELSPDELKDLSLFNKLLEEAFHDGRFIDIAKASPLLAGAATFAVNRFCKIKETLHPDGPGQRIASWDDSRMDALLADVDTFVEQSFQEKHRKRMVGYSRRDIQRQRQKWEENKVEGPYGFKTALLAATLMEHDGFQLRDLAHISDPRNLVADWNDEHGTYLSTRGSMYAYDFGHADHESGLIVHPRRGWKDTEGRGRNLSHFRPQGLLYMGVMAEYFKAKRAQQE